MAELASRTRTNDGGLLTGTYDLTAARTRVASRAAAASSRRGEVAWLRGVRCNESMRPNGSRRRANVGNGARHPGKVRRRARSLFPLPAPDDSQSFPFRASPSILRDKAVHYCCRARYHHRQSLAEGCSRTKQRVTVASDRCATSSASIHNVRQEAALRTLGAAGESLSTSLSCRVYLFPHVEACSSSAVRLAAPPSLEERLWYTHGHQTSAQRRVSVVCSMQHVRRGADSLSVLSNAAWHTLRVRRLSHGDSRRSAHYSAVVEAS